MITFLRPRPLTSVMFNLPKDITRADLFKEQGDVRVQGYYP